MEYLIVLTITLILIYFIFRINIKEVKTLSENKELSKITEKFPDDIEITNEMLKMLNNEGVKIEQVEGTGTSLYIALTNKISIADMKNNYARIQTIAHECIHSVQDRFLLLFNFIISNLNILYFLVISILTICHVIKNTDIHIFIMLLLGLIQFIVRGYLETDAMTKAKYLAKEYMEKGNLCSTEQKNILLTEYDKINKVGVPFTLVNIITTIFIKIIIFSIIVIIF